VLISCIGIAACTPKAWRGGPIGDPPKNLAPLGLYCDDSECGTSVAGTVTARGNDRVDWFAVEIPPTNCGDDLLQFELTWTAPRKGLKLGLEFPDVHPHPHLERSKNRIFVTGSTNGGTIVLGVHAIGPDGAGDYALRIRDASPRCGPARDIFSPRPEGLVAPSGSDIVDVAAAGVSRTAQADIPANEPTLTLEVSADTQPGRRVMLVDDHGVAVRHGEMTIGEVWTRDGVNYLASARFEKPGWFRRTIELGWSHWFVRFRD
jgi:hypothetical protein